MSGVSDTGVTLVLCRGGGGGGGRVTAWDGSEVGGASLRQAGRQTDRGREGIKLIEGKVLTIG